jgi:hypothetical protein
VPTALTTGDEVAVRSFDRSIAGTVVDEPLYDPVGARLRG